jgi:hypothetical protein
LLDLAEGKLGADAERFLMPSTMAFSTGSAARDSPCAAPATRKPCPAPGALTEQIKNLMITIRASEMRLPSLVRREERGFERRGWCGWRVGVEGGEVEGDGEAREKGGEVVGGWVCER